MALNPEIQKKAQAELDAVVGRNRLPDFDDQQNLVYVKALMKEALRWQVVTPFSVPHMTTHDDEIHFRRPPIRTRRQTQIPPPHPLSPATWAP